MTDEPIPSLAEAMAEIRRLKANDEWLRADNERLRDEKTELCIEGYQRDTIAIKENTAGFAEMMAEIRRLRAEVARLKDIIAAHDSANQRLRARVIESEANTAGIMGTLAKPTPDEPVRYTHDVPPSAPPHNE